MTNFQGMLFSELLGYPLRFSCATGRDVHHSTVLVRYWTFPGNLDSGIASLLACVIAFPWRTWRLGEK